MRKKNFKGRCEKRQVSKCEDVCRTYDAIQRAYLDRREANKNTKSIRCNVPLKGPTVEDYMTDFVCIRSDGEMMVRECVFRLFLTKPLTLKLLDMSREYWSKLGVKDWGMTMRFSNGSASRGSGVSAMMRNITLCHFRALRSRRRNRRCR